MISRFRTVPNIVVAAALVTACTWVQPVLADDFVPVNLSGLVFLDVNGDGVLGPEDTPLDSWLIDLSDGNQTVAQTYTNASGVYTFDRLGAGTFFVYQDPFANWITTPDGYTVTTESGLNVGGLDLAVFQLGYVAGQVLTDRTGDGFSPDDTPLNLPVSIDLYRQGSSMPIATTTAQLGRYMFSSLGPGVYTVQERTPAGYTLTAQTGATTYGYSGFRSDGNDFDNYPAAALTIAMSPIQAIEGASFTGPVASFTSTNPAASASDFAATVTWGDGASSTATISANPGGGFLVCGTHVYAEEGSYTVAASVADSSGHNATAQESISVTDAELHGAGRALLAARSSFLGVVATLADDDAGGVVIDYAAAIDWGDGTSSTGSVSAGSTGGFAVSGSHTYADGRYTITTAVTDQGGARTSATSAITVDTTPPATSASVVGNVLTLSATDNVTGVKAIYYAIGGGPVQLYTGPAHLKNGNYTVRYWSVDVAGNTEPAHSRQVKVNQK